MASEAVNNYITKRYERWLDYSLYHCGLAGISDEATDVLNEVICSLLQKQSKLLDKLLDTKKNGYTELDFFVLKMIKLNASSPTSQYSIAEQTVRIVFIKFETFDIVTVIPVQSFTRANPYNPPFINIKAIDRKLGESVVRGQVAKSDVLTLCADSSYA